MAFRIGRLRIENGKAFLIYMILLSAFLNPVLRPSAESNITLFRLLLPFAIILIALTSRRLFLSFLVCIVAFTGFSVLQHFLTSHFFYPAVSFSANYLFTYLFHYGCIILIFFLVLSLRFLEGDSFEAHFVGFSFSFIIGMSLFMLVFTVLLGYNLMTIRTADNINNIACMMCAGLCFVRAKEKNIWCYVFWCALFLLVMYKNDSKATLMGALVQIVIVLMLPASARIHNRGALALRMMAISLAVFAVAFLLILSPRLNGYSLRELIYDPIQRFLRHELFPRADTSVSFRTNSSIAAFDILRETFGLGVGTGNTGRVLKVTMENVYEKWANNEGYSLHNWWLELMTDFGLPMILAELILFLRECINYLFRIRLTKLDQARIALFLSFPIWSIGASGLITEYYSLAAVSFFLISGLRKEKHYGI